MEERSAIHRRAAVWLSAGLIQADCPVRHGIRFLPRVPVELDRGVEGVARLGRVVRYDDVQAGEATQHPGDLGAGHVLDEPQQAGAAGHR
jgi:hypothetical protein